MVNQPKVNIDSRYEQAQRARSVLADGARRLLKPLVRLLLRHSIPFQSFAEIAKRAYIEVGQEPEFGIPGRGPSKARLALITGLTRPDVAELLSGTEPPEPDRWNRAATVLSAWTDDSRYRDKDGVPRVLPFRGPGSFTELVRDHGADMPAMATLDELVRVGCVERLEDSDEVRLLGRRYVPDAESVEVLEFFGTTAERIMNTMSHNILNKHQPRHFQQEVWSRAISPTVQDEVRVMLRKKLDKQITESTETLEECEDLPVKANDRTSGVGYYYFEE